MRGDALDALPAWPAWHSLAFRTPGQDWRYYTEHGVLAGLTVQVAEAFALAGYIEIEKPTFGRKQVFRVRRVRAAGGERRAA